MSAPVRTARRRVRLALLGAATLTSIATSALAAAPPTPIEARFAARAQQLIDASLESDVAYRLLGELSDHYSLRISGSERLEQAIDWSMQQMRELGLQNVRKEEVQVPVWIRGEESLALSSPMGYPVAMLGLGMSVGTSPEGIEAEVLVVDSFDDLAQRSDQEIAGKIVLFDVPYEGYGRTVPYRVRGASAASARGAVAALVRSIGPDGQRLPHTGTLRYDDAVKPIPAAAISSEDASMMRRMQDRGDRIVARLQMQARTEPDRISHNVIGEVIGRELPDEIVVIGGHIDSWDVGQGAQDDGAGCMIAVGAAELMLRTGLVPRRTVRVVLWTNEENGLRGAEAYRDRHRDELDRHVAAIESDSGNGPVQGFRFDLRAAAVGAANETEAGEVLARARERGLSMLGPLASLLAATGADSVFVAGSGADVGPIAALGVPGLGLHHETTQYFEIHHTAADTFDRIDPRTLQENVAAMAVMAWVLAEMEGTLRP